MVQVAEVFVKAMYAWQIFVQVSEMVLAELGGFVALSLEDGSECYSSLGESYISASLTNGCQTGADGQFARDEVGAPCCAARLGIVVGEHHTLRGKLVEVRRLAGHDSTMIGADIKPTDVISHYDENVGFLLLRPRRASG